MGCSCTVQGGKFEITNLGTAEQKIGEVKGIEPISFCHWVAPEWGDEGQTAENTWYKAALIAVATINTIAQIAIAQKRYQIAKDYANIAKDKWNRFKNSYAPFEQEMLSEAGNEPIYIPDYDQARRNYTYWNENAFGEADRRMALMARTFSLCVDSSLTRDMAIAQALATDDAVNFGYRWEEAYARLRNDMRWNRRSNLLNLGRDLEAMAANYAGAANTILSGLGAMANEGANGAISLLGYLNERRDTAYPTAYSGAVGLSGDAGVANSLLYSGAALGPRSTTTVI